MTLKEKMEFIYYYLPGNVGDIAMMVPCHVNTLYRIKKGDENITGAMRARIESLYEKAIEVRDLVEE